MIKDPFVLYRLPNEEEYHLIIDKGAHIIESLSALKENAFVIAAYENSTDTPIWAFSNKKSGLISKKDLDSLSIEVNFSSSNPALYIASQREHQQVVNELISEIKTSPLNKGVLSRIKSIERKPEPLNLLFKKIAEKYSQAFVYVILLPNGQIWCGASPEVLANYRDEELQTMALAGTQSINKQEPTDLNWENKEIEEQIWVQQHIIDIFTKLDIPYHKSETYTRQAGHIGHLCTDFSCQIKQQNALNILEMLHPTPAICGSPTEAAKKAISKYEKHKRDYYSGYIGLFAPDTFQLFVNLRCMQIQDSHYYLYVGGGITSDSDAKKEWLETENKAITLSSILSNSSLSQ